MVIPLAHYNNVMMIVMASQITSLAIVYSTIYSGVDQRKHHSSASLAFVRGNSSVTGDFPAQMASKAENISIWWCHHDLNCTAIKVKGYSGAPTTISGAPLNVGGATGNIYGNLTVLKSDRTVRAGTHSYMHSQRTLLHIHQVRHPTRIGIATTLDAMTVGPYFKYENRLFSCTWFHHNDKTVLRPSYL